MNYIAEKRMATMENIGACTKVIESSTFKNGHYCTLQKLVYDRQCYSTSVCVCDDWDSLGFCLHFLRCPSDFRCTELDGAIRSSVNRYSARDSSKFSSFCVSFWAKCLVREAALFNQGPVCKCTVLLANCFLTWKAQISFEMCSSAPSRRY